MNSRLVYFPDENHWILKRDNSIFWYQQKQAWLTESIGAGPSPQGSGELDLKVLQVIEFPAQAAALGQRLKRSTGRGAGTATASFPVHDIAHVPVRIETRTEIELRIGFELRIRLFDLPGWPFSCCHGVRHRLIADIGILDPTLSLDTF